MVFYCVYTRSMNETQALQNLIAKLDAELLTARFKLEIAALQATEAQKTIQGLQEEINTLKATAPPSESSER